MSRSKQTFALAIATLSLVIALPAAAEVTHQNTNPYLQVIEVRDEAWKPADYVSGTSVPAPWVVEPGIVIDGVADEAAWSLAEEVEVPLSYGTTTRAWVRALYTDEEVFIRVRWEDATQDREHHPWTWDADQERYVAGSEVEDSVMLSFEAGCEWTPSLLGGYPYDFDAWHWMAARSDPVGQAVDLYGNVRVGRSGMRDFVDYPSRVREQEWQMKIIENHDVDLHAPVDELDRVYIMQPVWTDLQVRAVPDGGPRYPQFAERLPAPEGAPDDPGKTYPQYQPVQLTGGAGEVPAKGHWQDGFWTVEFRRVRMTPSQHIYDTIFNRTVQFSVQVFDGAERLDEASESGRLFLTFLPKEAPLVAQD